MKKKTANQKSPDSAESTQQDASPRTQDQQRMALRQLVKLFYDFQRLRIQAGGRTKRTAAPIELHPDDVALLGKRSEELGDLEAQVLKDIATELEKMPFFNATLGNREAHPEFKGIGPTLAGVILSEFDITKADTVSKFWSFAGLAPRPAVRCKRCFTPLTEEIDGEGAQGEHQVFIYKHPKWKDGTCDLVGQDVKEEDRVASGIAARPVAGEKLPYNSWLRTKLVGVMAANIIKAGNEHYRKFYDDYKNRWASAGKGRNDGHRHQAALRYMVKMILLDIWKLWREHEGLSVRAPYAEEYLGKIHHN